MYVEVNHSEQQSQKRKKYKAQSTMLIELKCKWNEIILTNKTQKSRYKKSSVYVLKFCILWNKVFNSISDFISPPQIAHDKHTFRRL